MNVGNLNKIKRKKTFIKEVLLQTLRQPINDTINVFGGKQSDILFLFYWFQLGLNIYIKGRNIFYFGGLNLFFLYIHSLLSC